VPGPPVVVLVANAVILMPSTSVIRSRSRGEPIGLNTMPVDGQHWADPTAIAGHNS